MLLLLPGCLARGPTQPPSVLVAAADTQQGEQQQGEQQGQGLTLNPRIRLHRRRSRQHEKPVAANASAAMQMLVQGTPTPRLDRRITIPKRAPFSEVAVSDLVGDSFVAHFANGFVDAEGVVRSASGSKPGPYHGCWTDADNMQEKLPLKFAQSYAWQERDMQNIAMVVVLSRWSADFFHWMAEVVPRIVLGMPHLQNNPKTQLLIDCGEGRTEPPDHGYMNATLDILGVPRSQVTCYEEGTVYLNLREAVWPSPTPCGSTQVTPMRKMLAKLPMPLRPVPHDNTVLLYKRPGTRRLLNHDDIESALTHETKQWPKIDHKRASLEVFDGSGSLQQQIKLFHKARCLVGPHGAGMVMMLFAPATFGTAEVSPGEYGTWSGAEFGEWDGRLGPNHCFRFLSAKLGLRHAWVVLPWLEGNDVMEPEVDDVMLIARDACGVDGADASAPQLAATSTAEDAAKSKARALADAADAADAAAADAAAAAARADAEADAAARELIDGAGAGAGAGTGHDAGKRSARRDATKRTSKQTRAHAHPATDRGASKPHRPHVAAEAAASTSKTQLLQVDPSDAPPSEAHRRPGKAMRDAAFVMSTLM